MSGLPLRSALAPMREADLETVSAVESRLYEFPWTSGNFRDSLAAAHSCWVCRAGGELQAYAVVMIAAGEAHLLNLSVASAWQGQGLGQAMLDFVIGLAGERNCRRLLLEVRPSNGQARRLYKKNAFVPLGVRKNYYPASSGREDALLLERAL